jgi:hypothetical protein
LADPPEIGISKISEDAQKKKVPVGFFGNCLRMQKPQIKFVKLGHWDMALFWCWCWHLHLVLFQLLLK